MDNQVWHIFGFSDKDANAFKARRSALREQAREYVASVLGEPPNKTERIWQATIAEVVLHMQSLGTPVDLVKTEDGCNFVPVTKRNNSGPTTGQGI